jgi:hypothetical protein
VHLRPVSDDEKKGFIFEKKPISDKKETSWETMSRLGSQVAMSRQKLFEGDPLTVMMRVVNDRLDYSITGLSDTTNRAVLANGIIEAVREFETEHRPFKDEKVSRSDGRIIIYNRHVEIDWRSKKIYTSFESTPEEGDVFMRAMGIVVSNLQEEHAKSVPQN